MSDREFQNFGMYMAGSDVLPGDPPALLPTLGSSEALPTPAAVDPEPPLGDGEVRAVRDARGRFVQQNPGGPGHPHAGAAAKLRAAVFRAVQEGDVEEILEAVKTKAKKGDLGACRLLLSYSLGEGVALDLVEKVEKLEAVYVKSRG